MYRKFHEALAIVRIGPKICQDQPPTMYSRLLQISSQSVHLRRSYIRTREHHHSAIKSKSNIRLKPSLEPNNKKYKQDKQKLITTDDFVQLRSRTKPLTLQSVHSTGITTTHRMTSDTAAESHILTSCLSTNANYTLFMVALCNRADHIYFHPVSSSSSSFFFFFLA